MSHRNLEESELLSKCQRGDRAAYGAVVERFQLRVFNLVLRLVRNRSVTEELTQESFVRAYQHIHSFDPQRPFAPWILRIATNLALNHLSAAGRRERPLPTEELLGGGAATGPQESELWQRETLVAVARALDSLPQKYRVPFILKHLEELSYEEIEKILGLAVSVLKMRVHRARRAVREYLEKNHPDTFAERSS